MSKTWNALQKDMSYTYQRIDSGLLREAAKVARHERHEKRKVGAERTSHDCASKLCPAHLGRKEANHGDACNGDGVIPQHEQSAAVGQVCAAESSNDDEDQLRNVLNTAEQERVEYAEAETIDDKTAKLFREKNTVSKHFPCIPMICS